MITTGKHTRNIPRDTGLPRAKCTCGTTPSCPYHDPITYAAYDSKHRAGRYEFL